MTIQKEIGTDRRMAVGTRPKVDIVIAILHAGEETDEWIAIMVTGLESDGAA